jgi:hypothetical protein
MYTSTTHLEKRGIQKVRLFIDDGPISCEEVYARWQEDADFRKFFVSTLSEAPFETYRWETLPATLSTVGQPFEFVIIDSPYLEQNASAKAFREFFTDPAKEVVVFPNLGKDALLIVPTPVESNAGSAHLASFLQLAPQSQIHALWMTVGTAMTQRIGQQPIWLNTAGGGVPWLHVRLDSRPKYYRYGPYRGNL